MFPSISHHMVFRPIYRELSIRGHDVTVVTPCPLEDPDLVNLSVIDLNETERERNLTKGFSSSSSTFSKINYAHRLCNEVVMDHLDNKKFQMLLNSGRQFDIVLVQALGPLPLAVAAKFKVPIVCKYFI